MKAILGAMRSWALVGLIGWTIVVAIWFIAMPGGLGPMFRCAENPWCGDPPAGPIWALGCVVILAIWSLTRKRL